MDYPMKTSRSFYDHCNKVSKILDPVRLSGAPSPRPQPETTGHPHKDLGSNRLVIDTLDPFHKSQGFGVTRVDPTTQGGEDPRVSSTKFYDRRLH